MGLMTWCTSAERSKQRNANGARPTTWHVRKLNNDEDVVENRREKASWMLKISRRCSTWRCRKQGTSALLIPERGLKTPSVSSGLNS
jgi:hypothetical protein